MGWADTVNAKVAASPVGYWFHLDGSGHPRQRHGSYFLTEIRAGLASFFAMAYIIAVNSAVVADSGGTCVCPRTKEDPLCNSDEAYALCVEGIKRDSVTATAAISALSTFCMGVLANLPVGLAPGMGLNAYFTYTVVGRHGSGLIPYRVALTAIFVEGFIFLGLAICGMRQWLARAIPRSIKLATAVGIGLFLAIIGLTYGEGIGLIVGSRATPTELAGCSPQHIDPATGTCPSWSKMRYPAMWLAIFCGGFLTVLLSLYRVRGAIIIGVILVSVISWPRGTSVTYFPDTPIGDSSFAFFKKVVDFHPIEKILNVQQWNIKDHGAQFGLALITFLYVDILDCTATLYSMAGFAGLVDPVTQDFEGSSVAYMVDAVCISISAILGMPPVTVFIDSGAGISEGGKTGLTAVVTGLCFFISIFFAPIFASIPPWATGCVLILIGSMMVSSVTDINWKYMGDAIPAFLTIALMPFTFSIADGLIAGVCSYMIINTVVWLIKVATRGRIVPPNIDDKEPWTWRIPGGLLPPWLTRLRRKNGVGHEDQQGNAGGDGQDPKSSGDPCPDGGSDSGRGAETTTIVVKE
ncbi:hypothetical protein RJ55_02667 [Drechmeria coniospora]|nr:hypothetical protein RJ55_02667 [Drechmeria coniospora]